MLVPVEMRAKHFDDLVVACSNAKNFFENGNIPDASDNMYGSAIACILNQIFPQYKCINVLFTNNTDNICFGIYVDPTIVESNLIKILLSDEEVEEFNRFAIEIDCKILDLLSGNEIASYIIEEVSSIMGKSTLDLTRAVIHETVGEMNEVIEIEQSINYTQILTFAFKDTLQKVGSLICKDQDALGMGDVATALEIKDSLVDIREKLRLSIFGLDDTVNNRKLGVLRWCLLVYKDPQGYLRTAEDTLNESISFTGSQLLKAEIAKTTKCIRRAANEVVAESASLLQEAKGLSLFNTIKKNGLRGLEEDLFEYRIRVKACNDQDESIYLMRQINTRIGILRDYLETNTDISPEESARWRGCMEQFMLLREDLLKKKLSVKKNIGFYVDYDAINALE